MILRYCGIDTCQVFENLTRFKLKFQMKYFIHFIIIAFLLSSCVAKKKFVTEYDARRAAEQRETTLRTELGDAKTQVTNLTTQLTDVSRQGGSLDYVNSQLVKENQSLKEQVATLNNSSSSQIQQLNKNLQEKTTSLTQKEQIINDLQKAVNDRNDALKGLYARVDTVMQFYKLDGIKTEYKEEQAIVVLPVDRLFTAGTAQLSKNGIAVLQRLAPVLAGNPNIDIRVEGHTDNAKPKNKAFADNWALSSDQAVAVARAITKGFDISANQVLATGRSEFSPRASNETTDGRLQNRRVEILVSPKTAGLLRLMERKLSNGG